MASRNAEHSVRLPPGLLGAIGLVESGRIEPLSGAVAPWPWTVNVDGAGHFFPSRSAAARFAEAALRGGARDVDVGCFQISLEQHPGAFASLDAAFDPAGNADFAARLLKALKGRLGSWKAAIAAYHSAWPALGAPYRRRVLLAWGQGGEDDPVAETGVILQGPAAGLVRVITPDTDMPAPAGLPAVVTP